MFGVTRLPAGFGRIVAAALLTALCGCGASSAYGQTPALVLERTIVLKDVAGRIDHLAVDAAHGRLFVAELGNGSVEAVDLKSGAVLGRIAGLHEPQGLAYLPAQDELVVASGGDGSVRFFRAADLAPVGSIGLGGDADNVRVDAETGHVVVGFGSGALAVIDPTTRKVIVKAALPAHPEGFQLEGGRAYVNVPGARSIHLLDVTTGRQLAAWSNGWLNSNYSLALDPQAALIAVVYRLPPTLAILDVATGARRQTAATCADADDVFFDHKRRRIYVICGSGAVDLFEAAGRSYARLARIPSRNGARTGLFAPQLDRLFVAARAAGGNRDAAILIFRPAP
ncbi:MAG: repeat containing protein [Phenylobacterium sp.]|nr:repeat containing protein [Phenylobacterium sp.]